MPPDTIVIREATAGDMPDISRVRFSVVENATTPERLAARGITNESVAASFPADSKGWVAEEAGEIVAFAIADRAAQSIFALFVLPSHEGRGFGTHLLTAAVQWLWDNGATRLWLATGPNTRAARFYACRGWTHTGDADNGDIRFELSAVQYPSRADSGLQEAVRELAILGPLPGSASPDIAKLRKQENALRRVRKPISDDEARALIALFGPDDCHGLAWTLVHLIESAPNWPLDDCLRDADTAWVQQLCVRAQNSSLE